MSKIAIDVVLLPPKEMMEICFKINRRAFEAGRGRFRMSEGDFVPHISLSLGCVEGENLNGVLKKIEGIVESQGALKLRATGIGLIRRDDGNRGWLKVGVSDELRGLHEKILDSISDNLVGCDSSDVLVEGDATGIGKGSKKILNDYRKFHAYGKYDPHLTLCCFDSDMFGRDVEFPIDFVASRVAVFRIGDGCTCRRKVWEGKLK